MSVFDNPKIFTQITVNFSPKTNPVGIDIRGNPVQTTINYQVRFAIFPVSSNINPEIYGDELTERYRCRLLGVLRENETIESTDFPSEIVPGEIGNTIINGRYCQVKLDEVIQSSVSSIINPILGSKYQISVVSWSR